MKTICLKPFQNIAVHSDGSVWVCCHDWLPTPIGNLNDSSFEEIWNSETAKSIRASILDGSYSFCNSSNCPFLVADTLPRISDSEFTELERYGNAESTEKLPAPKFISLTYDATCNLKCPSCRSDYIIFNAKQKAEVKRIHDALFEYSFNDAVRISMTGFGDPFSSSVFREFLRTIDRTRFPNLRIDLMTNGLLLTPKMWETIRAAHELINSIHVSIDGCSENTYVQNRGGSFTTLKQNLEFISLLRKSNLIQNFEISFVVQQNNFHEMPDFVRLGQTLKCDEVLFQKIINWGTYSEADFKLREVHDKSHPDYGSFKSVLKDEIFDLPIVNLSNLNNIRSSNSSTLLERRDVR